MRHSDNPSLQSCGQQRSLVTPSAVATVQAAAALPVFLLAIPAGVLSDILDPRKFLIATQILLASSSIILMALSYTGMLSISALIALTFLGGVGAALMGPTWQAIVPGLVPQEDLRSAVALNSLGINIARAVGPAADGLLLATFGAAVAYGVDVVSYLLVIAALIWWPRAKDQSDNLSEGFFGAFRAGLRYARASRPLHIVLIRAGFFFAFASALWALLPLVARQLLEGGASYYGILLGAIGAGAVSSALAMPRLRRLWDSDALMLGSAVMMALVMAVLSLAPPQWLAVVALLLLGGAWITALTTLNGSAQSVLPNWVRGRGLALYLTVFNGAMTAGSLGWGAVGEIAGLSGTLLLAAVASSIAGVVMHRLKLPSGNFDLAQSDHWPAPLVTEPVAHDRGPVLVLIEYQVEENVRSAFIHALYELSQERKRDGAYGWGATEDSADPRRIVEWFMVESWAEHLRQHRRISKVDADLQGKVLAYHVGVHRPVVRHLLTIDRPL